MGVLIKYLKNHIPQILLIVVFIWILLILPKYFYKFDQFTWAKWVELLNRGGMNAYYSYEEANYFPLYTYVLRIFGFFFHDFPSIYHNLYLLKAFVVLFDLGSIYVLLLLIKKLKLKGWKIAFLILNIAYFYNTLFWGQIDSIHTFFIFLSIYLLIIKKPVFGSLSYLWAINFKYQSLIFSPIILLFLLLFVKQNNRLLIKIVISCFIAEILILIPFWLDGGTIDNLITVIKNSVGFFPYISYNAYNFWQLILGPLNVWKSDTEIFIVFSYRIWGLLLFGMSFAFCILPFIKKFSVNLKQKKNFEVKDVSLILLTMALINACFFFFNTEMHERYLHPSILFISAYAIINSRYFAYLLLSLGYFLNLEKILQYLPVSHNFSLMGSRPIAIYILIAIIIMLWELASRYTSIWKKK